MLQGLGSRLILTAFAALFPAQAFAFAVFAVPVGTPATLGQRLDVAPLGPIVPLAAGQGVPVTWKQTTVPVILAFAPDPVSPLTNGTTTWNENAISALNEWTAVGANFAYSPSIGTGSPCVTDGVIVAAFDPTLCTGLLPPPALGVSRLVGIVDSFTSLRIVDADVAMIPIGVASAGGSIISDAFDGPMTPPNVDFRRVVLHEFGHSLGLAHPDEVFGDTSVTLNAVMHSSSGAAFRLSADDKQGVLALYPAAQTATTTSSGGDGGGGGNALALALLLPILAAFRVLRRRAPV